MKGQSSVYFGGGITSTYLGLVYYIGVCYYYE